MLRPGRAPQGFNRMSQTPPCCHWPCYLAQGGFGPALRKLRSGTESLSPDRDPGNLPVTALTLTSVPSLPGLRLGLFEIRLYFELRSIHLPYAL